MSGSPLFGRRRNGDEGPVRPTVNVPAVPSVTMNAPMPAASTSDSLTELRTLALQQLDPAAAAALSPERLSPEIEKLVADIATERRIQLNAREQRQLASELVNDMLGLGPLQPLLDDDGIADIMVNGPDRVFIEKGGRVTLSNVKFRDAQHVANICQRIASGVGRRIDESSPMVDARLMDGSRVNIVFPPLALDGPYISIRKFTRRKIDFARLVAYGSLTAQVARVLEIAGRSRLNMIISGGTGSGKTTLLNALVAHDRSGRTRHHHRGRGRIAIAAAACGAHGNPAAQPGRQGRGYATRPGEERAAHAARAHHHRRSPRRRGVRHVAGDEHRP